MFWRILQKCSQNMQPPYSKAAPNRCSCYVYLYRITYLIQNTQLLQWCQKPILFDIAVFSVEVKSIDRIDFSSNFAIMNMKELSFWGLH